MEGLVSEIFIKSSRVRAVLGFISSNYLAHPIISNIANSINDNQVKNKQWLVSHVVSYINNTLSNQKEVPLKFKLKDTPSVLVLAGWYGLGGWLLTEQIPCHVTVVDKDPECAKIGKALYPNLLHKTADLNNFDVLGYDIIICTSCEHITDDEINSVLSKKDKSTVVFLQSNNYNEIKDHINCKKSVDDFANSLTLSSYKKYTLTLDKYERFMVIGK